MNVKVEYSTPIYDGTEVVFRSPVDCSQVTGLIVYYPENGATTSKEFAFADAHGNNVGDIDHLFAENVVVKVILDVTTSMAFVQNADTNAYLEGRFKELEDKIGTGGGAPKSNLLVVTIDGDIVSGETCKTDRSSQEIFFHIKNGGSVIVYLSNYNEYIEPAFYDMSTISCYLHHSKSRVQIIKIEDDVVRYEEVNHADAQDVEDLKTDMGDISIALDSILEIQNELIGGDGV